MRGKIELLVIESVLFAYLLSRAMGDKQGMFAFMIILLASSFFVALTEAISTAIKLWR